MPLKNKGNLRAGLLIAAALLMLFGAFGNALVMVPDLHGDLIEIGVRPTVLRGTVSALYFAAAAMFVFALMVSQAAFQSMRGAAIARTPLVAVAAIHITTGAVAFSHSYNPHHLGAVLMGVLIVVALAVPASDTR